MVFSLLHWLPSAIAAVLTIVLVLVRNPWHKIIGPIMAIFALIGLWGFLDGHSLPEELLSDFNMHTIHAWTGLAALVLSLSLFVCRGILMRKKPFMHCKIGRTAAAFAAISLVLGLVLLLVPGL